MTFRPVEALRGGKILRWRPAEGEGLEHAVVTMESADLRVRGMVIGGDASRSWAVFYDLVLTPTFRTRSLRMSAADGRQLDLSSPEPGRWQDGEGRPAPALTGCVDVDLAGTPLTNTLPIRREPWSAGDRRTLSMVYIPFDSMIPTVDRQIYTCIHGRSFRYEAADGSFEAELDVDEDGFVTDYPGLFSRI